ncbi:extra-large guanine nucleotide-binding protein 1-like isoform X2 [Carica papaya]|uniref:extra-large guanine nucleotide-binding protein 1-like isoform X2 n=1 Tax=Carica papaya TaxID=3649 RepID=UPI000B8C9645|nr:extra-large guanine nucleotide-binding protein 1-like isoform X2 [Carica papaya]
MAAILRKILPVAPPRPKDDDDGDVDDSYNNNFEYSIALEYHGPPVGYDIPRAVPVEVGEIPIASSVPSSFSFNDMSLPIIQPIIKTPPLCEKASKDIVHQASPSSSTRVDSSGALGRVNGDGGNQNPDEGTGSSCELRSNDGHENFCELSRSSEIVEIRNDCREAGEFRDYMNPADSESVESGLTSGSLSSEVFSCREEEDGNNETPHHVKRPSVVTFCEPETEDTYEESVYSEVESLQEEPKAVREGKKGSCYKCLNGNRLTEKVVCIVCDAKYCYKCVRRAMGSMPEGRKCVTCIGKRISESRRESLGKPSRMLRRLLSEFEVKQIMSSEISCKANQLTSRHIYVNDEPLSQEDLVLLQTCSNPPKKLRPGSYWYDKVAGYWGKDGQKPSQIISPQLSIGGNIRKNASNGNTNIMINNREITKVEHLMLQLSGVQCEGKPHFWVSADGSYQEEGQKQIKGRIWDNARAKVVCSILSLPTPPHSVDPSGEEVIGVTSNDLGQKTLQKLLLVGYKKSGTSSLYKQAKLLYKVPFTEDERQSIKLTIQTNLYYYFGILLEGRERFEEESLIEMRKRQCLQSLPESEKTVAAGDTNLIENMTTYSIGPRLKAFSDWLLKVMASGNLEAIFPAAGREYAPFIEELWKDKAIQATYSRRRELKMLPIIATYFLEHAVEISRIDYEPSDMDTLYAEGIASSNGLSCTEFSFPNSAEESSIDPVNVHDSSLRYQLIRVHPKSLGENCKWLAMFEDVDIVVFCISLTDYDEFTEDSNGVLINKMLASRQLFETIVTHPTLTGKKFLLILNKFDLFEEKMEHTPLTKCEWFHDFNPVISYHRNASMAQRAFHYIAVKFKRLFQSLTASHVTINRKHKHNLFVSQVTALEQDRVEDALKYAREILEWNVEEPSFNELSTTMEESTTS